MKRALLLVSAALVMSACGQATTEPASAKKAPAARSSHDDSFCESGYVIAYDENGNPICVPDPNGRGLNGMTSGGMTGKPGGPNGTSGTSGTPTPPDGL